MSNEHPDPTGSIDLRDFGFMPLDVRRLLTSETWIEAADDPRVGHVAMSLWCESGHQVPAGSLPDNEKVLYRLSMCPTMKEWQRVRDRVLAGWVKGADGRLHHATVTEKARDSWEKKVAQRSRTAAATEARERKRRERVEEEERQRDVSLDVSRDVERNEQRNVERDVRQGTRTGTGRDKPLPTSSGADVPPADPIFGIGLDLLKAKGVDEKAARSFLGLLRKQHGDAIAFEAIEAARREDVSDPIPWLRKACDARKVMPIRRNSAGAPEIDFAQLDYSKGLD